MNTIENDRELLLKQTFKSKCLKWFDKIEEKRNLADTIVDMTVPIARIFYSNIN